MATPSASSYNADAIEVLSGLDPVRKRPGMYTDTSRPNHLAQEVIDNSVDEALAGHAKAVHVILHADHSLEVSDDGRGMPVDIHPEEGVPGVELILTKLHAGGKFSNKNYQFLRSKVQSGWTILPYSSFMKRAESPTWPLSCQSSHFTTALA